MLSKCPENNQKTTCFVVSPYHFTYYLKSFCFFWFCPGNKLYSECPCCPISCVALVLNWFVTVHFGFLFELISGCGVLGRIPRIHGPLSTLFLSYYNTSYKYYFPFLMIVFELIGGCGVLGSIPRIPAPPFFTFPFLPSSSQATWKTGQFTLLSWDSIIHLCFRESCGYNSSTNSKKVVYIVLQLIQRKLCA